MRKDISQIVDRVVSDNSELLPYYVHGGDVGARDCVMALLVRKTGSLVVPVMPLCDYYEVDSDELANC